VALSYFSQTAGIVMQQFLSAATGLAVAVAFFRALARKQAQTLGNAWVDIVRGTLYILLPMAFVFALILVSQGVVQNFSAYTEYFALESGVPALIAQGPAASEVAIKMLGSNGGGFFNSNGAHPFENPTTFSNLLSIVSILLIPAALIYTFGCIAGDRRQAWALLAAMFIVFTPLMLVTVWSEHNGNPRFDPLVIDQSMGNMEGKEVRFGSDSSALWAVATTATSNGSVNAMHDSFTPLGGMIPLIFIQFGEVIFGGVGTGAYGMLIYVLLTVFMGGLMVGRTPEYLGKKLGAFDIKMASLCILIPAASVLLGTAIAISTEAGVAGISNPGAQGFTEVLYAVASASNNNGSAFAGLSANSPFYNILLGVIMLIGRYGIIIPTLALAGSLAVKNKVPVSSGTLPTHTPLFTAMLVGSILMIDVLTYVPALALGPIAEHMHLFHVGDAP
jgi:potassium-transporting ATPase potassium-binding subunit